MSKISKITVVIAFCLAFVNLNAKQNNAMPAIINYLLSDDEPTKFPPLTVKNDKLLKTGQTVSYMDYDDGFFELGADRKYLRIGDIVRDEVTGLMWQDNSDVVHYKNRANFANAKSYCTNLKLGGYKDWRLPEIKEFMTLVYIGSKTWLDPVFKYTKQSNEYKNYYWSNTIDSEYNSRAWVINLDNGKLLTESNDEGNGNFVRCVRGKEYRSGRIFQRDNAKEVVTDINTKLMWQDNDAVCNNERSWKKAIDYCENLNFAGYTDWRLPNYNESMSILNRTKDYNIDDNFNYTCSFHWTSTSSPKVSQWSSGFNYVAYRSNDGLPFGKEWSDWNSADIRCVRGGHSIARPNFKTSVNAYRISTGQKTSYNQNGSLVKNNSLKDDGYYKSGLRRSYERNNEIVIDQATGLQWQDNVEAKSITYQWKGAMGYCSNLVLGGYSDWRLPDVIELNSIINYGNNLSSGIIDTIFQNSTNALYATSSLHAAKDPYAGSYGYYGDDNEYEIISINFFNAKMSINKVKYATKYHARCVRGKRLTKYDFKPNNILNIVYDPTTNLTWQNQNNNNLEFEEAINYCENLTLAGKTDWRLPNINEVISLTSRRQEANFYNIFKFSDDHSGLLSSTASIQSKEDVYTSDCTYSHYPNLVFAEGKNSSKKFIFRCVRTGKTE